MTAENKPLVYISILNWNNYADTLKCIDSVVKQNYADYKLFVVDNASSNDSVKRIRESYPQLEIIVAYSNLGYAAGHQLIAEKAIKENAEVLWILNNDVEVKEGTCDALVKAFRQNPAALQGSVVLEEDPNGSTSINFIGDIQPEKLQETYSNVRIEDLEQLPPAEITYCHGCSFLIPIEVIKKFGFIDTSYFLYFEEYDYALHLKKLGIPSMICPSSIVVHKDSGSMKGSAKLGYVRTYYRTRNLYIWQRRHLGYSYKIQWAMLWNKGKLLSDLLSLLISPKNEKYYTNLATFHALIGVTGKTVAPEKMLIS